MCHLQDTCALSPVAHAYSGFQLRRKASGHMITCFIIVQNVRIDIQKFYSLMMTCALCARATGAHHITSHHITSHHLALYGVRFQRGEDHWQYVRLDLLVGGLTEDDSQFLQQIHCGLSQREQSTHTRPALRITCFIQCNMYPARQ